MPYVIYASVSGRKVGTDVSLPPSLAADGLAATFYEVLPDPATTVWDPAQRLFVPLTVPKLISRQTFMDRLGQACTVGMQVASVTFPTDTMAVQQQKAGLRDMLLRFQIVTDVDVTDPRTIAGVDALIAAGLLPAANRAAVLA